LDAWISDAEVAESGYTAFASKKGQAVTARLIVRRVRDLNEQAAAGQDELFPAWRCHASSPTRPLKMLQSERHHRDHATVEQVFADLTSGPPAHLPGFFAANAAWLPTAAMAHNLLRAVGVLASLPFTKAKTATIRCDLIAVVARTAQHGRSRIILHHRLRPARRSGLTGPNRSAPRRPTATRTSSPSQEHGQVAKHASGRKKHAQNKPPATKMR
jgi:hypothetical protein